MLRKLSDAVVGGRGSSPESTDTPSVSDTERSESVGPGHPLYDLLNRAMDVGEAVADVVDDVVEMRPPTQSTYHDPNDMHMSVREMQPGDAGYVTPWSLVVNSEGGKPYIDGTAWLRREHAGTSCVRVECHPDGLHCTIEPYFSSLRDARERVPVSFIQSADMPLRSLKDQQ
jgi:hypothetical protein